ncbi:DeoR/GlpR family DNA-binding transcription regulator [Streptomyces sp. NPDC017993]|uniref:DeoR/GlpR family DNA-binding transcription regulator n=1 Tax=Streptomyces sp. NPDC017993 TaxID=3365027 RepID=UPI0037B8A733
MSAKARLSQAALEERRQAVLSYVVDHGETRIGDLATRFDVSLMTIHRDLDDLAGRHLLRKERGRAVAFPALTMEVATRFRESTALAAKTALSAAVAERVRPGSTVLIDDSTTLYPLADALADLGRPDGLTVITNSIGIAQRLGSVTPGVAITLLGGTYESEFNSCTGPEVTRALSRIRADLALMSAVAVQNGQLFHPLRAYADVKEAMLASADEALLLVDHSKFGKTATYAYGSAGAYDTVLTDPDTPDDQLTALQDLGVSVQVVSPEAASS